MNQWALFCFKSTTCWMHLPLSIFSLLPTHGVCCASPDTCWPSVVLQAGNGWQCPIHSVRLSFTLPLKICPPKKSIMIVLWKIVMKLSISETNDSEYWQKSCENKFTSSYKSNILYVGKNKDKQNEACMKDKSAYYLTPVYSTSIEVAFTVWGKSCTSSLGWPSLSLPAGVCASNQICDISIASERCWDVICTFSRRY